MKTKDLYLHLGAYLLSNEVNARFEASDLPTLKHVDLWKEQSENEKEEIAYSLPAVFIEFGNTEFENHGVGLEVDTTYQVTFYLEAHTWGTTAMSNPNQEPTLEPLALLDTLQEILALYEAPRGERLFIERTRFSREGVNNPVSELTYSMKVYRCA